MSNALAIAAVTSTLRYVLERSLSAPHPGPVGGAAVTTLRPDRLASDAVGADPGINIFLYQVTPNHAGNLTDLPTRRGDGSLVQRPVAALDLHYLLTGYGDDASLDGQRLLGRAILALAVTPVLTRDVVAAAMDAYDGDTDTAFLAASDLADQLELVKLSPTPLPLEELSRLWGVFQQTPYQLSVVYTATVVLLEADVPTRAALPVRVRSVAVQAGGPPRIDSLGPVPAAGPDDVPTVVTGGTTLVVRGTALRQSGFGPQTRIRVGPVVLTPEPGGSPLEVRVVLTEAVPAGLHAVQVQHRSPAPGPGGAPERVVASSATVPLLVHPTVTVGAVTPGPGGTVTLHVDPPLFPGQRAVVGLARLDAPPPTPAPDALRDLVVDVPPVPRDGVPLASITIPLADVPGGRWLVRLRVDGIDSVPSLVGEVFGAPVLVLP
ncbi:MAG: DUF4255 domain-containing protein [Cellulomonas sp.]